MSAPLTLSEVLALDKGMVWRGYWCGLSGAPIPTEYQDNAAFAHGWRTGQTDAGHAPMTQHQAELLAEWSYSMLAE